MQLPRNPRSCGRRSLVVVHCQRNAHVTYLFIHLGRQPDVDFWNINLWNVMWVLCQLRVVCCMRSLENLLSNSFLIVGSKNAWIGIINSPLDQITVCFTYAVSHCCIMAVSTFSMCKQNAWNHANTTYCRNLLVWDFICFSYRPGISAET